MQSSKKIEQLVQKLTFLFFCILFDGWKCHLS